MHEVVRPPIPATCERRPTVSGLVIPWVNVQLADGGVDFRSHHESRSQKSFLRQMCQVCAGRVSPPIVFLGGPEQLRSLQFDEPPMHPECAVYVSRACPMVAGRLERFADRAPVSASGRGGVCPDPGCDCGGFIPTPGVAASEKGGRPARDWYAVYASGYSAGVADENPNRVAVAVLAPEQVLAVRHVSTPGVGRTWVRTTREQVVL